jgi:hypothetical protein
MEVGALIKQQYDVIEHIGRGGMADVWSAKDTRLRRLVAVKTIARGLSADIDPLGRFEVEAQTIAGMEHPHILPIYDFGDHDSSLFIVMRYMPGGSLEDVLQDGPLPVDEVLRMGQAIASALDYAHEKNVIHLDLKPPNILLDSSGAPYLADFGLATMLDASGRAQNPGSGTLLYMAPEQLVAETIDHRADIYAFCIMLFHMFTGQLPFEGASPMALRQIQQQDELPDLEEFNPDLPYQLTDLLRHGTSTDPEERPNTHQEIMDEIREILSGQTDVTFSGAALTSDPYGFGVEAAYADTEALLTTRDADVLEAVEIYNRARHAWSGGQGRFLLGLTHYMLMADTYARADEFGLLLDEAGYQLLLRGALEYDYEVEYWWSQIDEANRRWVCLHTLRSGTTPARIRATYRLETLQDAEPPVIPKLVGEALQVETNEEAKLAALSVLATRAKLMKNRLELKTEYNNRLLTTLTRVGLELTPLDEWREHVYSTEVDELIAETAIDEDNSHTVADRAARTVGQMRSLAAVGHLAQAHRAKHPGALRALALVRDEAPALPNIVPPQARIYAWITNTMVRLSRNPLDGIARWLIMLLVAWLAFGQHVYTTFRGEALFTPERWGNALAIGLIMGLFASVLLLVSDEASRRLRGFWPWWGRLLLSSALSFVLGILLYAGYVWLFTGGGQIPWDLMRFGSLGLVVAFVAPAMLGLRGWPAIPITTLAIILPIIAAQHNQYHQNFLCYYYEEGVVDCDAFPAFSFTLAPLIGLLGGAFLGWLIKRPQSIHEVLERTPHWLHIAVGAALAFVWAVGSWLLISSIYAEQSVTWDEISLLAAASLLFALLLVFSLRFTGRLAFIGVSMAAFVPLYSLLDGFFQISVVAPGQGGNYVYPLLPYDTIGQTLSVGLPVAFTLALGANGLTLIRGWWAFIGRARKRHERGGWASGVLGYAIVGAGLVSLLALFSVHSDLLWALGWSMWGFLAFVFGLATWRWARWGARGLLLMGVVLLLGGFLMDMRIIQDAFSAGRTPALLETPSLVATALSGLVIAGSVYGVLRRQMWGAIGLLALLALWLGLALFSPTQESVALLAAIHLGLLAYALLPLWDEMEPDRFTMPQISLQDLFATPTLPQPAPTPAMATAGADAALPVTPVTPRPASATASAAIGQTEIDPQRDAAAANSAEHADLLEAYPDLLTEDPNLQTEGDPMSLGDYDPIQTTPNRPAFKLNTDKLKAQSTADPNADTADTADTEVDPGKQAGQPHQQTDNRPKTTPMPSLNFRTDKLRAQASGRSSDAKQEATPDNRTEIDPANRQSQSQTTKGASKPMHFKFNTPPSEPQAEPDNRTEIDPARRQGQQPDSKPFKISLGKLRSEPSKRSGEDDAKDERD